MTTYSNPRTEAVITNWPIGNKRTTAHFAIEVTPGRGERATRYTIDPKSGRPTSTKKLTYSRRARIVDGDDGKTYIIEHSPQCGFINVMQGNMKFQAESIHANDPRFPEVLALFG